VSFQVAVNSSTNIEAPSVDRPEEIIDITSLSPGVVAGATLADPLDISYSEPKPESDEYCAPRARSLKDKTLVPPPSVVETVVPSAIEVPGDSKVVSAIHHTTLAHVEQSDGSLSEIESDTRSGGVFVSNESHSVVARCLSMKPNARIFGDSMHKVLQFCSDDHECTLLQEACDSFSFPIMEDELSKESVEEILYQAHDLSMKSFLACRADLRS
jgi:hypothetical protein